MANGNSNNSGNNHISNNRSTNQKTVTVLRDSDSQPIFEIGVEEFIQRHPDGSITFYRKSDNIRLEDGPEWNAGLLTSNPPVFVAVCQQCRTFSVRSLHVRPPSHGVTSLSQAKLCNDCGASCCPNHRRRSKWDQEWRCLSCALKHSVKEFTKFIFFMR